MSQSLPTASLNWRAMLLPVGALLGYWLVLIHQLGAQWSVYDQYGYGWAVPFLCAYLVWQRLRAGAMPNPPLTPSLSPSDGERVVEDRVRDVGTMPTPVREGEGEVSRSFISRFALPTLLVLCALLYAPTRLIHEANPIWRLTSWLWTLEVIAITLLFISLLKPQARSVVPSPRPSRPVGERVSAGRVRGIPSALNFQLSTRLAFPILFFLVAVPWPSAAENFLVQTLTGANVATTIELLNLFGIPALQHGNVIEITTGVVGVNEACSGIRSFQATLMLSLFFGELYSLAVKRRIGLCLLGFASSFGFNVGRTFSLTYIASKQGVAAIDKWHDPAGITILVWCFVVLWFAALVLKPHDEDKRHEAKGEAPLTPSLSPSDGEGVVGRPGEGLGARASDSRALASIGGCSTIRAIAFGLAAWLALVEVGVQFWYRSHEGAASRTSSWTLRVDDLDSSFTKVETPSTVLSQFSADEHTELRWQDEGANWQLYYFRWHPASSLKKRVTVQLAKTHGPEKCLPAAGMQMQSYLGIKQVPVGGLTLALQHYVFGMQGRPVHVFYAIYEDPAGTEELANRRRDFSSRLAAARSGSRNFGQRFLELAVWGIANEQQATAALQRQLEKLVRVQP